MEVEGEGGQKVIQEVVLGYKTIMALKCAVELRIADIIHTANAPLSVSQIASHLLAESPTHLPPHNTLSLLSRLMRFLASKNIFTATGETTLYGLTPASRYLVHDCNESQAPLILFRTHPLVMDPWQHLSSSIREGGNPFEKAHGCSVWEMASTNAAFKHVFHNGLMSISHSIIPAFLSAYKNGFQGVDTVVDVGGGIGYLVAEIVKANWPRIRGVNFDIPSAFENAPCYPGVAHQEGDMFRSIPSADLILMKEVLHDWSDQDCMKILRNCKEAIAKPKGKLVLIEIVLQSEGGGSCDEISAAMDLTMAVLFPNGKERTRIEWTKLLEEAGFGRIKFISTEVAYSVIEAYPS